MSGWASGTAPLANVVQPIAGPVTPAPVAPAPPKPLFDASDLEWISRYRRELNDPDPAVAANARYQLDMFAKRTQDDPTRRPAKMTAEQCRAAAAAAAW
jgi:hypothetical protein